MQPLKPLIAGPTQYLIVERRNGQITHERGPAVAWMDDVEHVKISVAEATPLDANEALVVYRQNGAEVQRRIVRGPALFVPEAQEWTHQFRWHGADPRDPRRKIPHALVFNKLRVIPDQMYFDVESVRTADDALLVVKLMVFFELMEIEVMLDQTHDPIADFINAVTADVIDFAGRLTFEQLKAQTGRLNDRDAFQQLAQRAGRIGYRINKVVFRGYEATSKLQTMHDSAIEARTHLKLDAETEGQAQELADLKLARERARAQQRQQMERADVEHQNQIKRLGHEEQLREEQAEHEARLHQSKAEGERALEAARNRGAFDLQQRLAAYQQRLTFLKAIQELEVDVTRYLVARHERPDRRIRVDGDHGAQLHLHGA